MLMTALCRDATVSPREDKKPGAVLDKSGTKWGLINLTKCFTFSLSSVMYLRKKIYYQIVMSAS